MYMYYNVMQCNIVVVVVVVVIVVVVVVVCEFCLCWYCFKSIDYMDTSNITSVSVL